MDKTRALGTAAEDARGAALLTIHDSGIDPAGYEGSHHRDRYSVGARPGGMVEQPEPIMQEKAVVQGVSGPHWSSTSCRRVI